MLKKGKFKKFFKPLDLSFLIPLVLGIGIAIVFVSKLILSLLQNYPSPTLAFFVGLIFASGVTMFFQLKKKSSQTYLYVLAGLLFGLFFSFFMSMQIKAPRDT